MAITIDDLPFAGPTSNVFDKVSILDSIISISKKFNAPFIGFVNGGKINHQDSYQKEFVEVLSRWNSAGLELGNHTYEHSDYNGQSFSSFKQDIDKGEILLDKVNPDWQQNKYFRHPFLHRGETQEKVDSLVSYLKSKNYTEAPVSIDNYDWQYAQAYGKSLQKGDTVLADSIAQNYLAYMMKYVHFYEQNMDSLVGKPLVHTLLIHANALNRDYLDDLLSLFKADGYSFVSLKEALRDSTYSSMKDTFVKKWGISWIHRWALSIGKKGAFFRGEPQVPKWVVDIAEAK